MIRINQESSIKNMYYVHITYMYMYCVYYLFSGVKIAG